MADPNAKHDAFDPDAETHGLRALDRLRDRVQKAAKEIERLRAENAALTARVRDLDALEPDAGGLSLDFGEDPDEVRAKVQGFIEAVDRLLAEPADEEDVSS